MISRFVATGYKQGVWLTWQLLTTIMICMVLVILFRAVGVAVALLFCFALARFTSFLVGVRKSSFKTRSILLVLSSYIALTLTIPFCDQLTNSGLTESLSNLTIITMPIDRVILALTSLPTNDPALLAQINQRAFSREIFSEIYPAFQIATMVSLIIYSITLPMTVAGRLQTEPRLSGFTTTSFYAGMFFLALSFCILHFTSLFLSGWGRAIDMPLINPYVILWILLSLAERWGSS
jgi:hypothetical protein